jgi:Antitoxin ParD
MSRLVIDVSGEQHQQIKALAALQGKTIKNFILEKLFTDSNTEDEKEAWEELRELLTSRIDAAETGGRSEKTMRQIAEDKLKDLGAL